MIAEPRCQQEKYITVGVTSTLRNIGDWVIPSRMEHLYLKSHLWDRSFTRRYLTKKECLAMIAMAQSEEAL